VSGPLTTEAPGSELLRIGSVTTQTVAEGPGIRFAIWAQGCTIRCPGCFNPHFWGTAGGQDVTVEDLSGQASAAGVDGVTLLGGEPFEQAPAFAAFAGRVRKAGLSVMIFTGFEREFLESSAAPDGSAALLAETDLLVDGRYRADLPDLLRPWVGSTNQQFHFLTDRYRHLEESLTEVPDRLELRISPAGQIAVNGWATVERLDALLEGVTPPVGRGQIGRPGHTLG
jgi:anaerobic ribonucleoside-triphosphate reductase activating protein